MIDHLGNQLDQNLGTEPGDDLNQGKLFLAIYLAQVYNEMFAQYLIGLEIEIEIEIEIGIGGGEEIAGTEAEKEIGGIEIGLGTEVGTEAVAIETGDEIEAGVGIEEAEGRVVEGTAAVVVVGEVEEEVMIDQIKAVRQAGYGSPEVASLLTSTSDLQKARSCLPSVSSPLQRGFPTRSTVTAINPELLQLSLLHHNDQAMIWMYV